MDSGMESESWLRLGVAAAMSDAQTKDAPSAFIAIASFFQKVAAQRYSGKNASFFSSRLVQFSLKFDNAVLTLKLADGSIVPSKTQVNRGIALKTVQIPISEWTESVIGALEQQAATDSATMAELRKILGP